MERTISGMMGKGLVNHNTRVFAAKNGDKERSRDNVEVCHSDIKEAEELEQTISGSKEELVDILHQQIAIWQETEQIRKGGEAIRQEVLKLSAANHLLKEQTKLLICPYFLMVYEEWK